MVKFRFKITLACKLYKYVVLAYKQQAPAFPESSLHVPQYKRRDIEILHHGLMAKKLV